MRLLIVDDDADVRRSLRLFFEDRGHTVGEADNGQKGLDRARERRPDAIICDGLMPVMDGYQFLQALKSDAALSSIPFLFFSAVYTGQREQDLARSLGADAFLIKPQPPETILRAIHEVTANRGRSDPGRPTTDASNAEFALEYPRVVATALEEKVEQLERLMRDLERTKKELQESEAGYRRLFEDNPQPMWVYDGDSLAFLAVNDAAVRKYGYSREEFLSLTIKDIRSPEEVPKLLRALSAGSDDLRAGASGSIGKKTDRSSIWKYPRMPLNFPASGRGSS